MGDQEKSFVNELIKTSETLSSTNLIKIENENILKELIIFRNFAKLWESRPSSAATSKNKKITPLFKISAHVASSTGTGENEDDNIILTVENVSDFDYNSTYWLLLIENEREIGVSKTVECEFKDSTIFKCGNVEKFSFPFKIKSQLPSSERTLFKCYLVFRLNWEGSHFNQQFLIDKITIDILHFLSLARRPVPIDNCFIPLFPTLEVPLDKSNDLNLTPSTGFKLCFTNNTRIVSNFIQFLLQDLNFTTPISFTFSEESNKYTVFYYSFRIEIVKYSDFEIGVHCKDPKILVDIKLAILSRLLNSDYHDGYKVYVNPPDSENCEKLQELRIELDSFLTKSVTGVHDFVQVYLLLRKCSENIKFSVTNTNN